LGDLFKLTIRGINIDTKRGASAHLRNECNSIENILLRFAISKSEDTDLTRQPIRPQNRLTLNFRRLACVADEVIERDQPFPALAHSVI
jgi:hypothetical protein